MRPVAVLAGDGIGPEITDATLRVLEATGAPLAWEHVPAGQSAVAQVGEPLPDNTLATIRRLGVALKAPLASPKDGGRIVKWRAGREVVHASVNSAFRRELGLFVNLRPVRSWPGVPAPVGGLDLVIVREGTEGIYSGLEHRVGDDAAEAIKLVTRAASERLCRFAFDHAVAHGRRRVTLGHKANVLHLTDGLLLEVAREVAAGYPGVAFDDLMIDALALALVREPQRLDVLVLDSQYGDILSGVAAGLVGSIGLCPGANLGGDLAVFEACHGAAPDIAGRGLANPLALVLSGALLLRHVGEPLAAERVERAVERVLAERRVATPDLGGDASTAQVADALVAALASG